MLAQYGVDVEDRDIALSIKLPFLFAQKSNIYMAGPMLQSSEWFNLYLEPIGFQLVEREIPSVQVVEYLRQQKTAMLGLQIDDTGKHAVVYVGSRGDALLFINNKWKHTDVPEQVEFTEAELLLLLGKTTMIATLKPVKPKVIDLHSRLENSISVIRRNLAEIKSVSSREETITYLRQKLNTLFRPMLLDGITMLQLIGETELAEDFTLLQRSFLAALCGDPNQSIKLGDCLSMDDFTRAAESYIQLIQQEISK